MENIEIKFRVYDTGSEKMETFSLIDTETDIITKYIPVKASKEEERERNRILKEISILDSKKEQLLVEMYNVRFKM